MTSPARDAVDAPRRWGESPLVDVAIVTLLAGAVFVVHSLSYELRHPFWLDEAWVATLTRAPLSRAVSLSSSTPIGWLLLVRLVPGAPGEQLRLVPMFFSAGTVAVAYLLVLRLPWGTKPYARAAATATGVVVLLAPVSLVRNDLKQYTADACLSLAVLALASRVEHEPGPRPLIELVLGSVVAVFFSTAAAFAVVAAFAGLLGASVASRSAARIRAVAAGTGAVAIAIAAYFALVVLPNQNTALRDFWDGFYLPASPSALSEAWDRFTFLAPALGLTAIVAVALFGAGCVVLARLGRPALATAVVLLWIEMIVVGIARRYPFLNLRTSHFLLIVTLVVIVIGYAGIVRVLLARGRWLVLFVAALTGATFLHTATPYVRYGGIADEDVRSAVTYVTRHRRAGDVVVVTVPSSYGFSYYWPHGRIRFLADDAVSMGFVTRVEGPRDVVYAGGLTANDAARALQHALGLVRRGDARSRILIVRSHLWDPEPQAWDRAFRELGLHPVTEEVGVEPIWILSGPQLGFRARQAKDVSIRRGRRRRGRSSG